MLKRYLKWIKIVIVILVGIAFLFIPLPIYFQGPGALFETDEMIRIDNKASEENDGELYMTTVSVLQATPLTLPLHFHPNYSTMSKKSFMGDVEDSETYMKLQEYYMDTSINSAIGVATEAAGGQVDVEYRGVYVLQITPQSDFFNQLKVGDLILQANKQAFENSQKLIDYIQSFNEEDWISLTVERSGEVIEVSGRLQKLPETGQVGIGIGLVDNTNLKTDKKVTIDSQNVGGPSAGLMYSLQIYGQTTGQDLSKGYDIAGSGTINPDGRVGPIGGIDKKVISAAEHDVNYFLAPSIDEDPNDSIPSNYYVAKEKAQEINTDMEVIPIETFQEALDFLQSLESSES